VLYSPLTNGDYISLRATTPTWCCTKKQLRIVPRGKRTLRRANRHGVRKYMVLLSNILQVRKRLPPFILKGWRYVFFSKVVILTSLKPLHAKSHVKGLRGNWWVNFIKFLFIYFVNVWVLHVCQTQYIWTWQCTKFKVAWVWHACQTQYAWIWQLAKSKAPRLGSMPSPRSIRLDLTVHQVQGSVGLAHMLDSIRLDLAVR
jgi:hypothetical protein